MPGDKEFRFIDIAVDFWRLSKPAKRNKCLKESVMNGSFAGVAGLVVGYISYTRPVPAFGIGFGCACTGYCITAAICGYSEMKKL